MTFRVGMKVECIDARPAITFGMDDFNNSMHGLTMGTVYIVRAVTRSTFLGVPYLGIRVAGIKRGSGDRAFYSTRFRPLTESKTDKHVSALKALLVPGAKIRETV